LIRLIEILCLSTILLQAASVRSQGSQPCCPEKADAEKQGILWKKMEQEIIRIADQLDGFMGLAILDLTGGEQFLLHGDEILPQASSIKIAVLAELYHQAEQAAGGASNKTKLSDLYTVQKADLVPGSDIMLGLTPGVTRITNRDLATMMVAVSDNSATNVLIDRLGMDNVNALLNGLGLKNTRLRRKMMDLKAAGEGRENVSTPREMMTLLEAIYRGKVLGKENTEDFFKVLSTHKEGQIPRLLPDDVAIANKPGSLEAVRNDSGIVFLKNRPFVICVMTTFLKNERAGEEAISQVAAVAYSTFERLARSSPYGRVISPK